MAAVPSPTRTTITTVVADGQEVTEEQRARLCDWLRANSIDPDRVPQRAPLTIEQTGDKQPIIRFRSYYLNEAGVKEQGPDGGGALQVERTRPLSVELPPEPSDDGGHLFHEPGFVDPVRCARCGVDGMRWQLSADRQPCTGPGPEESAEEVKP